MIRPLAPVDLPRRRLLRAAAGTALFLAAEPLLATTCSGEVVTPERELAFLNLHTGEKCQAVYWDEAGYQTDGLAQINRILRDFRTGQQVAMDPNLLDLLYRLQAKLDSRKPIHIISGYRSPKTNAGLRAKSNGVAKKSLHMQGRAIDLRIPGVRLSHLRDAALVLRGGGVGYYPKSDFVHLDTGAVRSWRG